MRNFIMMMLAASIFLVGCSKHEIRPTITTLGFSISLLEFDVKDNTQSLNKEICEAVLKNSVFKAEDYAEDLSGQIMISCKTRIAGPYSVDKLYTRYSKHSDIDSKGAVSVVYPVVTNRYSDGRSIKINVLPYSDYSVRNELADDDVDESEIFTKNELAEIKKDADWLHDGYSSMQHIDAIEKTKEK